MVREWHLGICRDKQCLINGNIKKMYFLDSMLGRMSRMKKLHFFVRVDFYDSSYCFFQC